LVEGLQPPSSRQPEAHLFLNSRGAPWTSSALRIAVRRACRRLGLDETHGEKIVAYTIRHTAATAATVAGVRDRHLADLMGHSTTRTTARYQHLDVEHLRKAAELLGAA
jgi:integrase/recombinase XerD